MKHRKSQVTPAGKKIFVGMKNSLSVPRDGEGDETRNVHLPTRDKERLLYRRDFFVGRHKELDLVAESIAQAHNGQIQRPVLEITGPVGLGKTWLLKRVADKYAIGSTDSERWHKRKTFTAYVDLRELVGWNKFEYWWYYHFLRTFFIAIPEKLDERPPELAALKGPERDFPLTPDELSETLNKLRAWIESLLPEWVPVLIFDSTEAAELLLLNWLEREILVPLVRTRRGLIIVAGRRPVVWREPEIRFHLNLRELGPLADEDEVWTSQAIEYQGKAVRIPQWVHQRYTFGHPGVAATIFRQLLDNKVSVAEESLRNSDLERQAIGPALIYAQHNALLEDVRPALHPLLHSVCTLRVFNATSLQEFASEFGDGKEDYKSKPRVYFRQAIRDVIEDNVVKWTASLSDYSIIPVVRRVLAAGVRVLEGKENFERRHQLAHEMYYKRLRLEPTTAPWSVPEILYHRAVLASLDPQASIEKQVRQELEQLVSAPFFPRVYKIVDDLVNRLKNESQDADLIELHQDLIDLIGRPLFDEIIKVLETYSQRLVQD